MSTQAANDFFNKLYTDAQLRKSLQGELGDLDHPDDPEGNRSYGEKVSQIGKQQGFDFTADEAKDALKLFMGRFAGNMQSKDTELSDADLQGVAGGRASSKPSSGSSICCKTC